MICYFLHTYLSLSLSLPLGTYLPPCLSISTKQTEKNEYSVYGPVVSVSESAPQCQIKQFQFYTYKYLLTFDFHTKQGKSTGLPRTFSPDSGSTTLRP